MIYQAKPQRGGKSIPVNTNNPPQDPPPPPEVIDIIPQIPKPVEIIKPIIVEEPTIVEEPIKVQTPKVKKIKPKTVSKIVSKIEQEIPVPIKLTFRQKIVSFFKKLFRMI